MIERYSRPEMAELFTDRSRWLYCLKVERAACEEMLARGWISKAEGKKLVAGLQKLEASGGVDPARVRKEESRVQHDVIAFVSTVAGQLGKEGRWVHFGLTSSDVLDTGLALQLQDAGHLVLSELERLLSQLERRARETADLPCIGRTHGMHAEPTIFGLKFLGFREEMIRNRERLTRAFEGLSHGKLSGAVGVYAHLDPGFEKSVLKRLSLSVEPVSTQVIPRDRHAELYCALAVLGAGVERISTEIRHLQRSEVRELKEGFSRAQKGSSAMPHKRNPISSENLTGCARLLRGYAVAGLENVALWHERDISHSSVERVALADALILAHYALYRLANLIASLEIDRDRVRANLEGTGLQVYSGTILLELVKRGVDRDLAYVWVQRCALLAGADSQRFVMELEKDAEVSKRLRPAEIRKLLTPQHATRNARAIFSRVGLKLPV